ncbi:MAG: AzlD domain-containing protein [Lachnospiraceae bacterium]|jgi:branched-subunit amino acid transport protein AzlD|nr:AzlD domain-containing protein [Lachnospiraceae bacterium]
MTKLAMIVAAMAAGTMLTRFLPFLVYRSEKEMPAFMVFLNGTLPYATIGMLVVYCLKDISLAHAPHGLPEFAAVALVAALHAWKRNVLLSIGVGTVFYMAVVQNLPL